MKTRMKNRAERRKSLAARLAIGGIAALVVVLNIWSAMAAPALSNSGGGSWQYYRDISVTENSGSALSAYQVPVQLSSSSFPTNARSDGADIRFTDVNGNELSYWIESWDYAGKNAKIWVKVSSIQASTTATIRMYYGNPSAGKSSNGDATFQFFDDFNDGTLDTIKWMIWNHTNGNFNPPTINEANGEIKITGGSETTSGILSNNKFSIPYILEGSIILQNGQHTDFGGQDGSDSPNFELNTMVFQTSMEAVDNLVTRASKNGNWFGSGYHSFENSIFSKYKFIRTSNSIAYYKNEILLEQLTDTTLIPTVPLNIRLAAYNLKTVEADWIFIRKYASFEPTLTLGAELPISSDATPPTISITSPASGQTFNTNTITVNGTASDDIALSKVEIKVGSGTWNLASGTNSWSRLVTLSSGSNVIYARASDTSGNTGEAWITAEYLTPTPAETGTSTSTPTVISTPVPKQPLLTVSQTTLKEEPEVGEEVLITVSLQNTGDATARNIRLTEQIPSSIAVSFIDGADKPGNLVTWEGELAPNRAHAIVHTIQIVENKDRSFPVIIKYEDEAGNQKETSSMVYLSAKEIPTPAPTPIWTKAPEKNVQEVKLPGFTAPMMLVGFVVLVLLVRRH